VDIELPVRQIERLVERNYGTVKTKKKKRGTEESSSYNKTE
jgi:bisphosphoglycerate-dependent phosphoglycerate mutase